MVWFDWVKRGPGMRHSKNSHFPLLCSHSWESLRMCADLYWVLRRDPPTPTPLRVCLLYNRLTLPCWDEGGTKASAQGWGQFGQWAVGPIPPCFGFAHTPNFLLIIISLLTLPLTCKLALIMDPLSLTLQSSLLTPHPPSTLVQVFCYLLDSSSSSQHLRFTHFYLSVSFHFDDIFYTNKRTGAA